MLTLVVSLTLLGPGAPEEQNGIDFFEKRIRPVLVEHCHECHGKLREPKGGLRLLEPTTWLRGGDSGPALVPGKPDESQLIRALRYRNSDLQMPPKGKLPDSVIADFERWVTIGAPAPKSDGDATVESTREVVDVVDATRSHWSFRPVDSPPLPSVKDTSWPRAALDHFILARLEAKGLEPAPPADRATIIRRLHLDLLGLLPSPEEVREFVVDPSPDAYERLVDRLLQSPAYGERWGRHWLDVARYGDSNGGDENHAHPNAFRFRNWVIDALNRDLPYDRFVIEQLAGDLLESSGNEREDFRRITATGFLVIGTKILAERDQTKMMMDMIDEQIDTTGRTLMGLTLGCARCHDHKFDPILTTDYYALAGIFKSTKSMARPGLWNERIFDSTEYRARKERLATTRVESARLEAKLSETAPVGATLTIESVRGRGFLLEAESFQRGNVRVVNDKYGAGIGVITDPAAQINFAEYDIELPEAADYRVELRYASAAARPGKLSINGVVLKDDAIGAVTGGWHQQHQKWLLEGVYPLVKGKNTLRIESEPVMAHIDKVLVLKENARPALSEDEKEKVNKRLAALKEEIASLEAAVKNQPSAMAVEEGKVQDERVHLRGSHLTLGDSVPRRFPVVFAGRAQKPLPQATSGRLEMARWLTDPRHPLTRRVIVNRIWRWHFGRGLVNTPDNFGPQGSAPTHPSLLDHLANRLVDDGWSLKKFHRRLLLSGTYQMSSRFDARAARADSSNRLHWRFEPRRLEGEVIRDVLLELAGRLDRSLGGAPLEVQSQDPKPEDLDKNRRYYEESRRRSVYLPVVRTNVYKMFTLFDFPDAASPQGDRATTTVPTQALFLMNSPFVLAQAEAMALRHIKHDARGKLLAHEQLVDRMVKEIFGRSPGDTERARAIEFLENFEKARPTDGSRPGFSTDAWTALLQAMVVSNEFVYIR